MIESILVLGLVTFRLAELIAVDDGPADCFLKLRVRLGGYDLGPNGEPVTSRGKLITCPWCLGLWIALVLGMTHRGNLLDRLKYGFAIAGTQAFLQGVGGRK